MMNRIKARMERVLPVVFRQDDSGATAIEYAMIASLISVAIVTSIPSIGGKVSAMFTTLSNTL